MFGEGPNGSFTLIKRGVFAKNEDAGGTKLFELAACIATEGADPVCEAR
jgi:hypothetical protein